MKLIAAAALVGLLAACNAGATTPSEQPLPTATQSTAAMTTPSSSAAAMSCTDAFAGTDLSSVNATTDLTTLADQLDATVARCASINDWTAALQTAAPNVSITSALAFLQAQCAANADLSSTPVCVQVGS